MNFCSLQEAYNTPSFAHSRKKKPCNGPPLAPTEMYEPRRDEFDGKEYARYTRSQPTREEFQNASSQGGGQGGFETTYKAMQRDMKYYCNEYGVCTPGSKPRPETFQSEVEYPSKATKPRERRAAAKVQPAAAPAPNCPLQPPRYEYPISEESKAQFDSAMQLALDDEPDNERTQLAPLPKRAVDMEGVDGFYDEEIESYLKTKEMKSAPMPEILANAGGSSAAPKGFEKTPFGEAMATFQKNKRPLLHPEPRAFGADCEQVEFLQNLWDMALFVLAGILLILLMEQLYKLAVYQGMRQTIQVLEPFLNQFRDM